MRKSAGDRVSLGQSGAREAWKHRVNELPFKGSTGTRERQHKKSADPEGHGADVPQTDSRQSLKAALRKQDGAEPPRDSALNIVFSI